MGDRDTAATQGTRDDRLVDLPAADWELMSRGVEVAKAIVANARAAKEFWGAWECLNDRLTVTSPLSRALEWYAPHDLGSIRRALAASTVQALMRISDKPGPTSATACNLAGLMANERVITLLTSDRWLAGNKAPEDSVALPLERKDQPKRIAKFKSLVPLGWDRGDAPPEDAALVAARKAMKNLRDRALAHSDIREVSFPRIDEVRAALSCSIEIAILGSLLFLGHTSGLDRGPIEGRKKSDVWHYFEQGLVAEHGAWLLDVEKLKANK